MTQTESLLNWTTIPSDETISKTMDSLKSHNIEVIVVENASEAKIKTLSLIPRGAQVMTMTSNTLEATGIADAINTSGDYDAVHPKVIAMDREKQAHDIAALRSASDWAIGSVHAVTLDGKVIIASATGSQLPAYAYGSAHVIWVVGAQKLVTDMEAGMKRLHEHTLPLESKRAHIAYGVAGSSINEILIINQAMPNRITMVIVKENLGF